MWASYILKNDIDASGAFNVIGKNKIFTGSLNGDDYFIRNVTINSDNKTVGLFSEINGTVQRVRITNLTINAVREADDFTYVGGVAGLAHEGAILSEIIIQGSISTKALQSKLFLGGLVGLGSSITIDNSLSTLSVSSYETEIVEIGGLAGRLSGSSLLTESFALGKVEAKFNDRGYAGAFAGVLNDNVTVQNSTAMLDSVYVNTIKTSDRIGQSTGSTITGVLSDTYNNIVSNPVYIVGNDTLNYLFNAVILTFAGGTGTVSNPYQIATREQFMLINRYLNASFILNNDISFAGTTFKTIGIDSEFTGVLDGNNYNISNVTDALFEKNSGIIRNLSIDFNYNRTCTEDIVLGVVARENTGTIRTIILGGSININLTGLTTATVGGAVGINSGSGLVMSVINDLTINIKAPIAYVGGIVGIAKDNSVVNIPFANGNITITGGSIKAGAYIGWLKDSAQITNYNLTPQTVLKIKGQTSSNLIG